MKFCTRCGLSVTGSGSKCPLCQHTLSDDGVESPDVFPRIETISHTHGLLLRCLLFGLISVSIVAVMLDWMFPDKTFWSGFAVAGAACVWISVRIAITGRGNIMKKLLNLSILISPLSVMWDIATGWHRWSIDFVLPCTYLTVMLAITVISRITRMPAERYLIYLIFLLLFGLIPAIFLAAEWNRVRLPSFLCVTCSLLLFSAHLVFDGPKMKGELRLRLHL